MVRVKRDMRKSYYRKKKKLNDSPEGSSWTRGPNCDVGGNLERESPRRDH